jgi:SAM-dependent methyltransferase
MESDKMENKLKAIIKRIPLLNNVAKIVFVAIMKFRFPGSKEYWEERYKRGGTSGRGSYGKLAKFKADVINSFVKDNKVNSVIDFGCGDGNQLSLFKIPNYIGLDVSKTAIKMCIKRFSGDKTKSFFFYDPDCFIDNCSLFKADLALSLDVIYHLIEDRTFETYMKHLFSAAKKYVIIYSSDTDKNPFVRAPHCKNRKFTKWVETNFPEWKLIKKIKNRFPSKSHSDFFIYKRIK